MVVDDDDEVRATLQDILEEEGFPTLVAADGRQAMALLQQADPVPSLILLDLVMPVMDGWAFRRAQQRDPRLAAIPVVAFSAHLDAGDPVASLGVTARMRKPLRLEGVVTLVEQLYKTREPNP